MPNVNPLVPAPPAIIRNLDHVTLDKVLVTPEMARRLLDTMHDNRSESRLEISLMKDLLEENNFFGGISPVFIDEGDPRKKQDRAWDGQHRFEAISDTGIPAWLVFIRGITFEESEYIDTGRKRSYADSLRIRNVPDYKRRSVISRMLALYEKAGIDGVRNPSGISLTPGEKDAWVDSPGMSEAVNAGEALARAVKANPSYMAYAVLRTARRDASGMTDPDGIDPDGFWESVRTGEDLKIGDAALTLRNFLMTGRQKKSITGNVDPRLMEMYVEATAWNKHVQGERWTRSNPLFDVRGPNGDKYFPSSQVPDFLPIDARKRSAGALRDAHTALLARKVPVKKEDDTS